MWRSQFWLHCTWTVIAALTLDTSCLRVEPLASVFSKCRCPFIHPGFPWRTLVWTHNREKVWVCVFCVCHSHRRDQSVMVYSAVMVPNTFSCAAPYCAQCLTNKSSDCSLIRLICVDNIWKFGSRWTLCYNANSSSMESQTCATAVFWITSLRLLTLCLGVHLLVVEDCSQTQ